ncbi:MAG: hypothetical protein HY049_14135 [Acidobacteria bacterium]|nr:hypothetical protein [Acidobacteriota bacterium]
MWGLSFISKVWPTIAGSPPNAFWKYSWLSTSTGSAPAVSSESMKVRP